MTTTSLTRRNSALIAARVVAGLLGAMSLAGATYFLFIAPADQVVWVGPVIDVTSVALVLSGAALKLTVALWPNLTARPRIHIGLTAVAIGIVGTIMKITFYNEPEGVSFLVFDGILLGLLLLARRRI